jgi:hypothetical protein
VNGQIPKADVSKAIDFTYNAVQGNNHEEREAVPHKMNGINDQACGPTDAKAKEWEDVGKDAFSTDEGRVLKMVMDTFKDYFTVDAYDGLVANLQRGSLGLVKITHGDQVTATLGEQVDIKQPVVVETKYVGEAIQA